MDTKIKRENDADVFDRVFDKIKVKYEPCEISTFSEREQYGGSRSKRDLTDHRSASLNNEDKKYGAVKLNTNDVGFTDLSTIECKAEQMKTEDDIDIHYEEVERKPREYELYEVYNKDVVRETNFFVACTGDSKSVPNNLLAQSFEHGILVNHQMIDVANQQSRCKINPKLFSHSSNFKDHERTQIGDKSYRCKFCSKDLTSSTSLKAHERIHTGEKPFRCKICSQFFVSSSNLRRHERVHTGEKPFQCKVCFKALTNSNSLKIHERIHTGEKPFYCEICSKTFVRSSNLKNHERIHLVDKSFLCKICSKSFVHKRSLSDHIKVHVGEKPFHCKICSKAFALPGYLEKHETIHARDQSSKQIDAERA